MHYKKTGRNHGDGATRKSLLQQIHADFPGNSTEAQRARLLAAMRKAEHVMTTEARLFLEVMNPSQRVTELRNQGAKIDTAWTLEPSEAGRDPHRQARYVLIPNQGGIAADLLGLLAMATVAGVLR
ncbi:helix-turn-helix domain-containing protein [Aromatoleum buckelii]|uniref:Winged helix-turn-helix domain-containing protein n=1 Tax=Aromatoleum buckelii TaxID=200254 RepID=A0ABX1N1C7_9RHOO|nr:helix-turn-helix domain-containing protein [Aromatoleum buckelii]MCK0510155.1 helix-turn-helix domain-containing protein [Aromatoleum buckelii]